MKNDDQKAQGERSRSFAQEMQQAFIEWVNTLPFIKRDTLKGPERKDLRQDSADQASASRSADGALAGRSLECKGRHQ